jgi:iron complex outermembrane receptor protein
MVKLTDTILKLVELYLEEAVPRVKFNLTNSLSVKNFFEKRILDKLLTEVVDANGDGQIKAIVVNGKR